MITIEFVRHGETDYNIQGNSPPSLLDNHLINNIIFKAEFKDN